ncbi:LCP family protein [Streptomyces sp. 4N509B]|uniref:LCP family protein n=1 Tax=Streptomyces sp. 4N509B TaxID=3457413 RepID=UPI003FD2A598
MRGMTRGQRVLWWTLLAFGVLLAVVAGVALLVYQKLDNNIRTDHATAESLERHAGARPVTGGAGGRTIMVIGSDRGSTPDSARSDTVLLLHLSADGRRAEVVGVPRDLIVDIPACEGWDGEPSEATPTRAQFNWAYQYGGAACTIRAFENFSGVRVDHHLVVGFEDFARAVDALGGVEVVLEEDEYDPNVGHELSAGRHLLDGEEALAYVRARVYVGDGSDLNRMARQQDFLRLLYETAREQDLATSPTRLYPVLDALTSAITADPGLDSLGSLYQLVRDIRAVPRDGLSFHTVPTRPHPELPDRLAFDQPAADRLFAALREDRRLPAGSAT